MGTVAFDLSVTMFSVVAILVWVRLRCASLPKPPASRGFVNDEGRFEEWVD